MNTCESLRSVQQTRLTIVFAGALTLLLVGAAVAQESSTATRPSEPTNSTPSNPAAATSSASQSNAVERMVITANKREEDPQVVPASVSVVGDYQLDTLHATQLTDFAPYVPGFTVNSVGTPGQATIALRGLAPISSGSTVATYFNEVPTGSSGIYQRASQFELDLLPYDIQRVEILRGPQGTLYGANSLGGLVKYVTFDPSLTTRTFRLGGGLSGVQDSGELGWDTHVTADLPLVKDRLGIRVSYAANELPGFINNVVNSSDDINRVLQQSALLALLWQPYDSVSFRFAALAQKIASDNNANAFLDPRTRRPIYGDLDNRLFVDEPFYKTIGLLSATVNVNLGWADFTSATGYSNTTTQSRTDATTTYGQAPLLLGLTETGISGFDLGLTLDKVSQELRLTSKPGGRFIWQLGFFYTHEYASNTQNLFLRQLNGAPYTDALASLNTLANIEIPSTYTEYAGFANATLRFTKQLSLGAGVRISHNDQDFAQNVTQGILLPLANTPGNSEETIVDFAVTPQFQLDKDRQFYVRIASGYQPGGPNVALPGVPPQVDATRVLSYEGGLKSEFLDRRLLFNVAGYHIDQSNVQIGTVVNNVSALVNAGDASVNGAELTLEFQPIQGLRLGLNGAYTHATLSDDAPSLGGRAGDRLPFIPELSGAVTADYVFPLWRNWNGHVGGGVRYVGQSFSQVESSPQAYRQDSYGALDLNADVSNPNWTIRIFARNVTDTRVYQTIIPITDLSGNVDHLVGVPIQPRTVGIEVDFKF